MFAVFLCSRSRSCRYLVLVLLFAVDNNDDDEATKACDIYNEAD